MRIEKCKLAGSSWLVAGDFLPVGFWNWDAAHRLAGGEAAAFVGAVRLKACPSITRQRIGIDHRLLFRLLPERVQVVDLIPRQDLERRIKTLT